MPEIIQGILTIIFELLDLTHTLIIPEVKAVVVDVKLPIDLPKLLMTTFIFLLVFGILLSIGLTAVAAKFAVRVDPRVAEVRDVLPGANCGACGFGGCQGYAEAVVTRPDVSPNLCAPGRTSVAEAIAMITGKIAEAVEPRIARVMCQGDRSRSVKRFRYEGIGDCRAAILAGGGDKACIYGCLGYGTCERVCPFGAIKMGDDFLPVVDPEKCTACGKCAESCPTKVIEILPLAKDVLIRCHSRDKGADTKKNCKVGCIACGICVKVCPYNAPRVENNLSRINLDMCRLCSLCVAKCPTKTIMDYIPLRPKASVTEECDGCGICIKVCPVNAASGELKKPHVIDQNKCIGCGICTSRCPVVAITGTFNYIGVLEKDYLKRQKLQLPNRIEN